LPSIDVADIKIPKALDQHHVDIDFSACPDEGVYHMARDGMHWGSIFHNTFSNKAYDIIINTSMFSEVRSKWKI